MISTWVTWVGGGGAWQLPEMQSWGAVQSAFPRQVAGTHVCPMHWKPIAQLEVIVAQLVLGWQWPLSQ
jgi:hypothetical protein